MKKLRTRWQAKLLCALLVCLLGGELAAVAETAAKKGARPKDDKAAATTVPPQVSVPDGPKLRLLIYTMLIAINQANLTGNYSVVRDLAAPSFREANSVARLAEIFAALRGRNLDLSPILLLDPKLVRPPALMDNGFLRLSGFFPSTPEQVNFDLAFQPVGGRWLLFGIAINTSPAPNAAASAPNSSSAPTPDAGQVTANNSKLAVKANATSADKTPAPKQKSN
jgi:hypothetical protein